MTIPTPQHQQTTCEQEIVIRVGQHSVASAPRSVSNLICPHLQYASTAFETDGGQVRPRKVAVRLWQHSAEEVFFPATLASRVVSTLEAAGLDVRIDDYRTLGRSELLFDLAAAAVIVDPLPGLARRIADREYGLLEVPRGPQRARAIAQVAQSFPRAKVFVACSTTKKSHEMAAILSEVLSEEVRVVRGGTWSANSRIVCGTFRSFDTSCAAEWHILIYEDAWEATGKIVHGNRGTYGNHRVYGFMEPRRSNSDDDLLPLEVLAGPVIYTYGTRCRSNARFDVRFIDMPLHAPEPTEACCSSRQLLEEDQSRNATIASVADAIVHRDLAGLCTLTDRNLDLDWATGRALTTAVITQSARHAEALAALLPNWMLLHRRPPRAEEPPRPLSLADMLVPARSIMTAVHASRYKQFHADVIIWAGGGLMPYLPESLLRRGGRVLVIDFDDQGHHELQRLAAERRRAYAQIRGANIA